VSLIRFEIRYADGRKEVTHVDGERALIGHGAHCDVRLPLDQAANEHVAVQIVGETVRVETKAFDPPATVNGLPFTTMPIGPDVPLTIGATRVFISLGDFGIEGVAVVKKRNKDGTSPFMKVLGVGVLVAGAYMFMNNDEAEAPTAPMQAPELFGPAATTCPQAAPDQARAFAVDKRDIAEGKRERSPFVPKDGVQAVELYEVAAACFRRAGDSAGASAAQSDAAQLRASITQDFRARRIRLEHLIGVGDYQLARYDVTVLRSLTEGKPGPWVNWLAHVAQVVTQSGAPQ
jgi:hypothetical protein